MTAHVCHQKPAKVSGGDGGGNQKTMSKSSTSILMKMARLRRRGMGEVPPASWPDAMQLADAEGGNRKIPESRTVQKSNSFRNRFFPT